MGPRGAGARAARWTGPIFLSIGYAACHWCHVMERESFEDEATAAVLNEHFVAIKVDREERPDLDALYMGAVQAMTGQGGWPMSVFLTPEGRPVLRRHLLPGHAAPRACRRFRQVLEGVRGPGASGGPSSSEPVPRLVAAIAEQQRTASAAGGRLTPAMLGAARPTRSTQAFDPVERRLGRGAEVPPADDDRVPAAPARRQRATRGRSRSPAGRSTRWPPAGIHDQLGGGFHRYATDAHWLVPHFEQMLYDNAQLARVYLHAWALTGDARYREVATGTLDYLLRELTHARRRRSRRARTPTRTARRARRSPGAPPRSARCSATDAAAVRGGLRRDRRRQLGGPHDPVAGPARRASSPSGSGWRAEEVAARLAAPGRALLARRATRPQPARDDKALAAWNGLAIAALADAARLRSFGDPAPTATAAGIAAAAGPWPTRSLRRAARRADGRLRRSWKDGRATADGRARGLRAPRRGAAGAVRGDVRRALVRDGASRLADAILERFADPAGGFFDTADDHERLIARPKDIQDNATPSGGAMATLVLLRLARADRRGALPRRRGAGARDRGPLPRALPDGLRAVARARWSSPWRDRRGGHRRRPGGPGDARLVEVARRGYDPFRVLAVSAAPTASVVPLLVDRFALHGRATAFVCRDFACRQPVHEPEALDALLVGS